MYVIDTIQLKSALERLCLVVPKRGTLPVLEHLRWRVVKGRLDLTATDLDNSLIIPVPSPAPPISDVDVLVPARELYQALKTETVPTIEIKIHDNKFEVHANNRMVALPCVEPKNFPRIPEGGLSVRGKMLCSALEAALNKALFCLSTESSRYCTDTIRLEMRESVFRIVGTDGHRLSVVEGAAKNAPKSEFSTLLLRSTASILSKLSGDSAWVTLSTCAAEHEHNLFWLSDDSMLIARPSQGQFPNYEKVMPKAPLESRVVFQRDELLDGLTKLAPTAKKAPSALVKFELSKSPACIKAEHDGTANRVALEHTRILGKARDIGFNHQYLTQYVKSLETDSVSMKLFPKGKSEAALFDSFRYQHLLMPLRD